MKQTKETKSRTGIKPRDLRKANSKGLLAECDDAIFVEEDSFNTCWEVLRTRAGGNEATVMFKFETRDQALKAAWRIAKAIGGQDFSYDPRKVKPHYHEWVEKGGQVVCNICDVVKK